LDFQGEQSALLTRIATAMRFIVRADEKLTTMELVAGPSGGTAMRRLLASPGRAQPAARWNRRATRPNAISGQRHQ